MFADKLYLLSDYELGEALCTADLISSLIDDLGIILKTSQLNDDYGSYSSIHKEIQSEIARRRRDGR